MDLEAKLQLKEHHSLECVNTPSVDAPLLEAHTKSVNAERALLVFVENKKSVQKYLTKIVTSANADHLTWVAYPKAGQLGTDLNRDSVAAILTEQGVQPVRQIALNDTWSALRFRPI